MSKGIPFSQRPAMRSSNNERAWPSLSGGTSWVIALPLHWPGGRLQPAKPVSSPPPAYPSVARRANVRGVVLIDAGVGETGNVTDMKVISGSPLLTQAAMEALRTWKYEPARLNGQVTATRVRVSMSFSLP